MNINLRSATILPGITGAQLVSALGYRTRALLGAPVCISTRRKWAPNKEPAPINEEKAPMSYIGMTTFSGFVHIYYYYNNIILAMGVVS